MLDLTEADWDRVMDVNLKAAFFVMQAAARRMLKQDRISGSDLRGKLIHTASIASYRGGNHLMTHYSATKAGVVSFARSAARRWPARVHVDLHLSGPVDTPMSQQIDKEWGDLNGGKWARIPGSGASPTSPSADPERGEDLAGLVVFLASRQSTT